MAKRIIKVGTTFPVSVTQEWIDESIPCDKGSCMLTLAAMAMLDAYFGENAASKVKSTNHGITFDIYGYRVLCVFDHQTGDRIYKYDETYRQRRSLLKARASVKPFKAKLMVESCQKIPVYPPMSEETKKALAMRRGVRPEKEGKATGIKTSNRRQLSV